MMRITLLLTVVATLMLLDVRPASACSCATAPSPEEGLQQSDAVFAGRVTSISGGSRLAGFFGSEGFVVRFAVSESWKGVTDRVVALRMGPGGGAACQYSFTEGEQYLVYARTDPTIQGSPLATNICDRTTLLAQAGPDLEALGRGATQPQPTETAAGEGSRLPMLALPALGLIAALLLLAGWRKGHSRPSRHS